MPANFALICKSTGECPSLLTVDAELCAHFGDSRNADDQDTYFWPGTGKMFDNWHDTIGYHLALGKSFAEVREFYAQYNEDGLIMRAIDYLDERYEPSCWRSFK